MKKLSILFSFVLVFTFAFASCGKDTDTKKSANVAEEYKSYIDAVDPSYAYELTNEINEDEKYSDNELGDRQAGSDAEHATAIRLSEEMTALGLVDVTRQGVKVDRIQANGSSLKIDGEEKTITLHAYQTEGTGKNGINAEIVYAGKGTATDYKGLDVKGKIVLFDINQREDWWVGTPVIQAIEEGAIACLVNNVGGFSEISDDAYNANDFCGPTNLPAASITRNDAKYLRTLIKNGSAKGTLIIDNEYEKDGTTYNVVGKIKGKDSSEAIAFGAHYDAYYKSFQDDTIAATGVLAIAKGMIDSGYTPNRDVIFVLHGAEEWGTADSNYDWAIGSYRQITSAEKDWQGKLAAFINFELPAYEFADYTYTVSAPESYNFVKEFTGSTDMPSPKPEGIYKDGILTGGYQTYTYSDDFSYYISGVPSYINGFLKTADKKGYGDDVFDFYYKYYHTNFDTKDTYNEKVLDWQLKFYGALGIRVDLTPAIEIDYTSQAERISNSLNVNLLKEISHDTKIADTYEKTVADYKATAEILNTKIKDINYRYKEADDTAKGKIWKEAVKLNKQNLAIFKNTQDYLIGISAEEPIVPHEWYQNNISQIQDTISYLEKGDVNSAVDESGWAINGAGEWYYQNFSKKVAKHTEDDYLGKYGSINWGKGKQGVRADVSEATISCYNRYDEKDGDFSKEIAIYEKAKTKQSNLYLNKLNEEIKNIGDLTKSIQSIA
ncbi:MAG: M28 family peptidase [Clostridiales Family XIII bacterium]|jgi:hypothetical protein|nr:M28 family peptidase [Clostridiales Family XIII bacterium]